MLRATALAILVAAAMATAAAAAEAPTRDEYVSRLEKICKPGALATERTMKGVREEVRREEFRAAGRKFAKATSIFGGTRKRMAAAPRPTADKAKLSKWFGYLSRQQEYLRKITAALNADQGIKAQRLTTRFIHTGNLANNVVLAFGFNYCSFKFPRYG